MQKIQEKKLKTHIPHPSRITWYSLLLPISHPISHRGFRDLQKFFDKTSTTPPIDSQIPQKIEKK
jgi:hypothetical protein